MAPKFVHRVILVRDVPLRAAILLKQEMLACGGEAGVAREVAALDCTQTDVLLAGTMRQFKLVLSKLERQPYGLAELAQAVRKVLERIEERARPRELVCREYRLPLGVRTYVMGILNVTPDSFSDGGRYLEPGAAVEAAHRMVEEGADIIDVGAESTRPGAEPVPLEEEWVRLEPVLKRLVRELTVPISVDTYKAEIGRRALEVGASIINDISGLQAEPELARWVASAGAAVVVMHRRGDSRTMQIDPRYRCLWGEILAYLERSIEIAVAAGVERERVVIDPGIGFGKTVEHNLEILRGLRELETLGCPILVGPSRKSFIGKVLDLPVEERLEGTAAAVAVAIAQGADIVRVHDVKAMRRVATLTDAIVRG